MSELSLILFDDVRARRWEPFSLTRPVGELLFGTMRLRERAERSLGIRCSAHLSADHLVGFAELDSPPVRAFRDAPGGSDRLFLSSRVVLEAHVDLSEASPGPVTVGGEVAGWYARAGAHPPEGFLDDPSRHEGREVGFRLEGTLLANVWELMSLNAERVAADVAARFGNVPRPALPEGVYHLGHEPLVLGENVTIDAGVVLDCREGPIWLDDGVTVRSFTRLAGPAYVGHGSTLLGGPIEGVSIGPICKVHGELSSSVLVAYSNKAHAGHMGHAYLGAWVNLGAETTNSDLKNNYGSIRIWSPEGETDTGEMKIGCFLGDHVKTGIGLLLNTGTVVGAGSNLYGAEMPPKYVPPFSWGTGGELVEYRVDKFLEVAERAMGRRQVELGAEAREQLHRSFERGRSSLLE